MQDSSPEPSCKPRSRGLPRSGVGPLLTAGYLGEEGVPQPRSRGFSLFGLSRLTPRQLSQPKLNCEQPRERDYLENCEVIVLYLLILQ